MGVIGDRRDIVNRSIESQTERVFGSEGVQATETVSASSTPPPVNLPSPLLPSVVVTLPTPNTEGEFSFGEVRLPEGPPTRSPIPPGWSYTEPVTENSDLPLNSPPRQEVKVITKNPSVSAPTTRNSSVSDPAPGLGRSQSAPASPTCPADCPPLPSRRRSPFLGITALGLGGLSRESSKQSLDWDNYASSPTFHTRPNPIPIVSTPTTSLDSTPDSESFSPNTSLAPTANMSTAQDMFNECAVLHKAKNAIAHLINISNVEEGQVTKDELEKIGDKFLEFSDLVFDFSMKYSSIIDNIPVNNAGVQMTVNYWQLLVQEMETKVKDHRTLAKRTAIGQQASGLTDFEKKDLEIKEKHLALAEESKQRSREAEEVEKSKANAVAQSKYD